MVNISSSRCSIVADEEEITVLATTTQIKKLRRALLGDAWIRVSNGKILVLPAHKPPLPLEDETMEGFFPSEKSKEPKYKQTLLFPDSVAGKDGASIYVSSLVGYGDPSYYKAKLKSLEDAGFVCLRSRRDQDGKYWEIWYLGSPIFAKGEIKGKSVEEIRSWLCNSIVPGNVSIEGENWGLSAG